MKRWELIMLEGTEEEKIIGAVSFYWRVMFYWRGRNSGEWEFVRKLKGFGESVLCIGW